MSTSSPIIEFSKVNKWFGEFHVLRDIDLSVAKGERIVVCGPSGSGKSTLIRCVNRLEEHQSGVLKVDGTELTDDVKSVEAVRRQVGMVFQQFNLFPHLTVLENLTLAPMWVGNMPKAEAEERAMQQLKRVRISEQALKYPLQLSGGQQQRVAIARSLCLTPKIMLFDEPTSDRQAISEKFSFAAIILPSLTPCQRKLKPFDVDLKQILKNTRVANPLLVHLNLM